MANIMAPVGAVLASLSAWSGNNGQVQSSDSESFSEEHEERRSRSSSVELDSCVDNAFFSPSLELHTILPKICFDGLRELDVDMSRTTRTGVTTDIQGSRSQISAVSRGLGISQWLTSNVSRDHELRKPLTLDVRESRSLKSDVSPYPGGCQPSSSDASSDLAITHVGSPNLEINRLATDIATPTASVLSSPVSPGTDEEISVLFMTPVAADRSLLANAVVSPEVGSFQEADVDQSEDLISSPVEVLDDSPDVLEDPCFTQATLDSIATARLMPLIKQELKCWIQVRRHFEGLDLSPADLNRDKSKEGPYQPTEEDLRRRSRRRDLNKLSARRCREKKIERETLLEQEAEELSDRNQTLQEEIIRLRKEQKFLQRTLLSHRPCKCQKTSAKKSQRKDSGE